MKALILAADGFEDLTLFLPWYRLREEDVEVIVASPFLQAVTGQHGYTIEPDTGIQDVNPDEFDLLLIPDGPAAELLRLREEAVETLVRGVVTEPADEELLRHGVPIVFRVGCARPGAGNHRERRLMGGSKVSQCPDQAHTV